MAKMMIPLQVRKAEFKYKLTGKKNKKLFLNENVLMKK